jgi:hypothetical protein
MTRSNINQWMGNGALCPLEKLLMEFRQKKEIMSYPSSESTILVNTTHKMLSQLQQSNPNLVATMPTPRIENILGYDTAFNSWKLFLCQYKRPYNHNGRFYYYLNINQNITLFFWPIILGGPSAFFPLVLASSDQHLAQINPQLLDYVIFVDALNIWPISTMIRVNVNLRGNLSVEYKVWRGPWVPVMNLYHWTDIDLGVRSCRIGGLMKSRGEPTDSSMLLREAVSFLGDNKFPSWWQNRAERVIGEHFEERSKPQFFEFTDRLLKDNRKREKPTTIASRSFRAFICPVNA